jgi:hypothetical protein
MESFIGHGTDKESLMESRGLLKSSLSHLLAKEKAL